MPFVLTILCVPSFGLAQEGVGVSQIEKTSDTSQLPAGGFAESTSKKKTSSFSLTMPKQEIVTFVGVIDTERGSAGRPILYPAFGLVGFVAAVITHGVLISATENAQIKSQRDKANLILLPFKDILSEYKHQELMKSSLIKMRDQSGTKFLKSVEDATTSDLAIESVPIFSMTQDKSALVLDNVVSIKGLNATTTYQNTVRVVSAVKSAEDFDKFWSRDDGRELKEESSRLYAASIEIALDDFSVPIKEGTIQKTIRYMEGNYEKFERGELIKTECNQVLIKNLRGNLYSVPLKNKEALGPECSLTIDKRNRGQVNIATFSQSTLS